MEMTETMVGIPTLSVIHFAFIGFLLQKTGIEVGPLVSGGK
jgi:hypothetical protein